MGHAPQTRSWSGGNGVQPALCSKVAAPRSLADHGPYKCRIWNDLSQGGINVAVELRALRPSFAAEVGGIDLSRPLDADSVRTVWDAINRYAVLVFQDQRLTDTQLRDFAALFGPLEIGRGALQGGKRRLALPQI